MPQYKSESHGQRTLAHLCWDKNTFDSKTGTTESRKHHNDNNDNHNDNNPRYNDTNKHNNNTIKQHSIFQSTNLWEGKNSRVFSGCGCMLPLLSYFCSYLLSSCLDISSLRGLSFSCSSSHICSYPSFLFSLFSSLLISSHHLLLHSSLILVSLFLSRGP